VTELSLDNLKLKVAYRGNY